MSKSTPRLGKGLSALLGTAQTTVTPTMQVPVLQIEKISADASAGIVDLPLDRIKPNPKQPRMNIENASLDRLADSLRQSGVLQPILVRRNHEGWYEIVAGERRWRAAQRAGLATIPAVVRVLSDAESFEIALIENLQREDLSPIERAAAYQQLIDILGVHPEELARRLGESRANIINYLRLLKLSDEIQSMIASGQLGMGQARALAGIDYPQKQLALAKLAVRRNLSVRQVEQLAKSAGEQTETATPEPKTLSTHLASVQEAIRKTIGLPVTLRPGRKKNSGRIIISYASLEDFDRVAEMLCGKTFLE